MPELILGSGFSISAYARIWAQCLQFLMTSRFIISLAATALIAISSSIAIAAPKKAYQPTIKEVRELKLDEGKGALEFTFTVLTESIYHCPGVVVKETEKGMELTFIRSSLKGKPKVDYPAKTLEGEAGLVKVVTVPKPKGAVFVRRGKELVKIYPRAQK